MMKHIIDKSLDKLVVSQAVGMDHSDESSVVCRFDIQRLGNHYLCLYRRTNRCRYRRTVERI